MVTDGVTLIEGVIVGEGMNIGVGKGEQKIGEVHAATLT